VGILGPQAPDAAPWLAQYLHELANFRNVRHNDQVDSAAQMLDWFKRGAAPGSNAGTLDDHVGE
jgi:hypothetical protein